ncbi:MAG TPA: vitamin K epoxide reductase family protein [Acidisarcina sp.]
MRYIIALLAIAGLVVSALALQIHRSKTFEPCSVNDHWDCGIVNHSRYAEWHHVPVAAIGIAGYAVLAALALARRRALVMIGALIGLAFALRLTYIEYRVLLMWCIYCVSSQAIIAAITLLAAGWLLWGGRDRRDRRAY